MRHIKTIKTKYLFIILSGLSGLYMFTNPGFVLADVCGQNISVTTLPQQVRNAHGSTPTATVYELPMKDANGVTLNTLPLTNTYCQWHCDGGNTFAEKSNIGYYPACGTGVTFLEGGNKGGSCGTNNVCTGGTNNGGSVTTKWWNPSANGGAGGCEDWCSGCTLVSTTFACSDCRIGTEATDPGNGQACN